MTPIAARMMRKILWVPSGDRGGGTAVEARRRGDRALAQGLGELLGDIAHLLAGRVVGLDRGKGIGLARALGAGEGAGGGQRVERLVEAGAHVDGLVQAALQQLRALQELGGQVVDALLPGGGVLLDPCAGVGEVLGGLRLGGPADAVGVGVGGQPGLGRLARGARLDLLLHLSPGLLGLGHDLVDALGDRRGDLLAARRAVLSAGHGRPRMWSMAITGWSRWSCWSSRHAAWWSWSSWTPPRWRRWRWWPRPSRWWSA